MDCGAERLMPVIQLQITKGATRDQKSQIVREFTDTLVRVLGKKPEHTHIVIQEIADDNWGFDAMLTDDWRKKASADKKQ
jgi:4-oxalocrotonate tautomerase